MSTSNLQTTLAFLAHFVEQAKEMGLNVSLTEFLGSDGIESVKEKVMNILIEHSTEQRRQLDALRTTVQELQASRTASPSPAPAPAPAAAAAAPVVAKVEETVSPLPAPAAAAAPSAKPPAPAAAAGAKPPAPLSFADRAKLPLSEAALAKQAAEAEELRRREDQRQRDILRKEAERAERKTTGPSNKKTPVRVAPRLFNKETNVFDFILENHDNPAAEFEMSRLFSKFHQLSRLGSSEEGNEIVLCDRHPTNDHLLNPKLRELTYPIFVKGGERVRFFEKEGRVATEGPSAGKTIYWYIPTREGIAHFREVKRTHSQWTDMLTFGLLNELLELGSDDAASVASH